MSLIIDGLILGGLHESFDRALLAKYHVTHVLNVASECNIKSRVGLVYAKYGVPDDCNLTNICTIMDSCIDFICDARKNGRCVFVHCLEGVSRSACVVLCYLIAIEGWTPEHAVQHLYKCRSNLDPYPPYLEQTLQYCFNCRIL